MPDLSSLLPVTVVAAIAIFVVKETVEYLRRWSADRRKIHALKALIARECELNYWPVKALRSILINVPGPDEENPQVEVRIERRANGRPVACIRTLDGGSESTRGIPEVHRELMSKFLLEIAMLNSKFFAALEPAYDSLAELEHVRQSLISIHDDEQESEIDGIIGSFAVYALEELRSTEAALQSLYLFCTDKALEKHRLR
jgi:hypothetical protein